MSIIIKNCSVIEPELGTCVKRDISIADRRFSDHVNPEGRVKIIDGEGLWAIPGLIDMHVHMTSDPFGRMRGKPNPLATALISADNLATALESGITSVRDLGAAGATGYWAKEAWQRQILVGARPFVAGPVIAATGGHGSWNGVEVDGADAVRNAVRSNTAGGSDVIKLMMRSAERRPELRADELAEGVQEAHSLGLPVAVHANFSQASIEAAVEAGCDTLEHGYALTGAIADQMHERSIALCPTISVLTSIVSHPDEWISKGGRALVERAISQIDTARDSFRRALQQGVTIIAGTDAGASGMGFNSLSQELEVMVEWGATELQVLRAATSDAAKGLRRGDLGTLTVGAIADLVLLRKNPLEDVRAYREIEIVVQSGAVTRVDRPARVVLQDAGANDPTAVSRAPR